MTIRIIKTRDIHLTEEEYQRFWKEYDSLVKFMVNSPSFETYVARKNNDD